MMKRKMKMKRNLEVHHQDHPQALETLQPSCLWVCHHHGPLQQGRCHAAKMAAERPPLFAPDLLQLCTCPPEVVAVVVPQDHLHVEQLQATPW